MAMDGKGSEQIATVLTEEKILTPTEYAKARGIRKSSSKTNPDPYFWNKSTVNKILCLQEYCGDVINFKRKTLTTEDFIASIKKFARQKR